VAWVFVRTIAQHTKDGFTFSHTHAKQNTKRIIKITNPKNSIEKAKRKEKRNQQLKQNSKKIFKNYKKN
jgi:hypothetical protein